MEINKTIYILKRSIIVFYLIIILYSIFVFAGIAEMPGESITRSTTKKAVSPTKEIVMCEINKYMDSIDSNCNLTAINFTYYAYFSFKREKRLAISNMEELIETLSEHSTCEVKYMKYNFFGEKLDYMNSSEEILYQDPNFQKINQAKVYVISDGVKNYRVKVVYECLLPKSDVYLSLKPIASRFSQSRPIGPVKTTVSGFHVKLNFLPLNGINVNVNAKTHEKRSYDYDSITEKKPINSAQRFLIFYHYKCRSCFANVQTTTLNKYELLDPFSYRSIRCQLRSKSCVYDGKCYSDNEKIDPTDENSEYACSQAMNTIPIPIDLDFK